MSMSRSRCLGLLAIAAAGALLAGCSSNSPTAPSSAITQQDADDATQQVGFMMAADNGTSPTLATTSGGTTTSSALSVRNAAGTLSSPVATATDTTFTLGQITWTLTCNWYNSGGALQGAYDPLTTVRVAATARGTGSVETASDTVTYGGAGSLDVTGIAALQDTTTTNAARHDTLRCVFTPRFRTGRVHTYLEGAGTLADVVRLKPVFGNPWPLSGTATWSLKVDRLANGTDGAAARHFEVLVVVTFDGTQTPNVVVTGGYHYKLNLQTGVITRA